MNSKFEYPAVRQAIASDGRALPEKSVTCSCPRVDGQCLRVELVGEASDPYVPCCALILSLLAQPLLAVPGVRHFLARLIPEDRSCCEPYGEASARSFLVRSRILVPLLALELFLFSIGTAGAVEIFSSSFSVKFRTSNPDLLSCVAPRSGRFSSTLTQVNMNISQMRKGAFKLKKRHAWEGK